METYRNLSGDSGVSRYEPGGSSILVEFSDGHVYLYDYGRPGRAHVEKMKELARTGIGLCTYITRHVQKNYARKIR